MTYLALQLVTATTVPPPVIDVTPGWFALGVLVTALNTLIVTRGKKWVTLAEQRREERHEKRMAFADFMRKARLTFATGNQVLHFTDIGRALGALGAALKTS